MLYSRLCTTARPIYFPQAWDPLNLIKEIKTAKMLQKHFRQWDPSNLAKILQDSFKDPWSPTTDLLKNSHKSSLLLPSLEVMSLVFTLTIKNLWFNFVEQDLKYDGNFIVSKRFQASARKKLDFKNRSFPRCFLPVSNESLCDIIPMKMCSPYRFIFPQIKLIFIKKVLLGDSFWNRGTS